MQFLNSTNKFSATFLIKFSIGLLVAILLLNSCTTVQKCPDKINDGNISSPVNTDKDELSPYIFDKEFYYTERQTKKNDFKIKIGDFNNQEVTNTLAFINSPLNLIDQAGLIKISYNNLVNRSYAVLAGLSNNSKFQNSDIYLSYKNLQDQWTQPEPLEEINTEYFESYPAISPDGNTIVFASDRPNGLGGIDLYKTVKDAAGIWSEPVNLGNKINTKGDDISPFINFDNSLFFASNGYADTKKFKIITAIDDGNSGWMNPHFLPQPINSEFNDISPFLNDNELYLSSDRPGGCGGYDIYSFKHCGDVVLKGSVESESSEVQLEGKIYLLNSNRDLINIVEVGNTGLFNLDLKPSNIYYIQYFNACVPNYVPEQMIIAPCSDTNIVKITVKFILPNTTRKFDFANYKVPFFVSGYYQPNTPTTLENLRLKFAYNLLGNDSFTKYIEKPGSEYDEYALVVSSALDGAVLHIIKILENSNDECIKNNKKFIIKVTGYSDPRPISEFSKYRDESIADEYFGFSINKDDELNNKVLSNLRAYFTARYLQSSLKSKVSPKEFEKVKWQIEGLGIDETEKPNEQKRRVNIEIGVAE